MSSLKDNDEKSNGLIKIVYFDEDSAMEYVDMKKEGRYIFNEEYLDEYNKDKSNENAAKLGLSGKFLNILGIAGGEVGASTEVRLGFSKSNNRLVSSTISSTILTDFLKEVTVSNGDIVEISDVNFNLPNNSFAYLKAVAPVLSMFSEEYIKQFDDLKGIDVLSIENVLDLTKGYFEFMAVKEGKDVILRLNTTALKNNYKLGDLLHMNLAFYAVKVGKLSEESIRIENYIGNLDNDSMQHSEVLPDITEEYKKLSKNEETEIESTEEQTEEPKSENFALLDLYDVIWNCQIFYEN